MMQYIKPAILTTGLIIAVSETTADVTFAPPVVIDTPGATADLLVSDLDGDGDLDIASLEVDFNFAAGSATGMVNVALNDGSGAFPTTTSFELATVPGLEFAFRTLIAADLDGDGDPDLAAIGTTASVDKAAAVDDPLQVGHANELSSSFRVRLNPEEGLGVLAPEGDESVEQTACVEAAVRQDK